MHKTRKLTDVRWATLRHLLQGCGDYGTVLRWSVGGDWLSGKGSIEANPVRVAKRQVNASQWRRLDTAAFCGAMISDICMPNFLFAFV